MSSTLLRPILSFAIVLGVSFGLTRVHAQPPTETITKAKVQEKAKEQVKEKAKAAPAARESATVPAPRDTQAYWMKLHESFLDRAKQGEVDLLFLGDSITQGWGGSGKDVWRRHYEPRKTANFGIGGDRTQHVLWRIQNGELEGISPKLAVLMIGTNNLGANTNDEIADGVTAIVKDLRKQKPSMKILLLGIFPRSEKATDPARARISAINAKIESLADGKHVVYKDIGSVFLEKDGSLSKAIMPDFLHLSRQGYQRWADAIEPTIWSLLDEATASKN